MELHCLVSQELNYISVFCGHRAPELDAGDGRVSTQIHRVHANHPRQGCLEPEMIGINKKN